MSIDTQLKPAVSVVQKDTFSVLLSNMLYETTEENWSRTRNIFQVDSQKVQMEWIALRFHSPSELGAQVSSLWNSLQSKIWRHKHVTEDKSRRLLETILVLYFEKIEKSAFTQSLNKYLPLEGNLNRKIYNFFLKNQGQIQAVKKYYQTFSQHVDQKDAWSHDMHAKFKLLLDLSPRTFSKKGTVEVNASSLKLIRELINYYSGYDQLMFSKSQEAGMTQLALKILFGENIQGSASLPDALSFELKELQIENKPAVDVPQLPDESYLFHVLRSSKNVNKEQKTPSELCDCLKEAAHMFLKDSIERPGFELHCDGNAYTFCDKSFNLFATVSSVYGKYLLDNPLAAKKLIWQSKDSHFFNTLLQMFPEASQSKAPFEDILKDILESAGHRNTAKAQDKVHQLLQHIAFSDEHVNEIACASLSKPEDVRALLPKKLLQLIVLLNQSSQAFPWIELQNLNLKLETVPLHTRAIISRFCFTPDFESLENVIIFELFSMTPDLEKTGFKDYIHPKASLAKVVSCLSIPSIDDPLSDNYLSPMEEVYFNWRCPDVILRHFAQIHGVQLNFHDLIELNLNIPEWRRELIHFAKLKWSDIISIKGSQITGIPLRDHIFSKIYMILMALQVYPFYVKRTTRSTLPIQRFISEIKPYLNKIITNFNLPFAVK